MSAIDIPSAPGATGPGSDDAARRRPPLAAALVWLIRTYQAARIGHVSPCRFTPTCSHYAIAAIDAHGARRGLGLSVRRLLRCRPGGPSGFDPVPLPGDGAAHPSADRRPHSSPGAM